MELFRRWNSKGNGLVCAWGAFWLNGFDLCFGDMRGQSAECRSRAAFYLMNHPIFHPIDCIKNFQSSLVAPSGLPGACPARHPLWLSMRFGCWHIVTDSMKVRESGPLSSVEQFR